MVTVPSGWRVEEDEADDSFAIHSQGGAVTIITMREAKGELEMLRGAMPGVLGGFAKELELQPMKDEVWNGMPGLTGAGTGQVDGAPATLNMVAVHTPSGGVFVMVSIARAATPDALHVELGALFKSLRPRR